MIFSPKRYQAQIEQGIVASSINESHMTIRADCHQPLHQSFFQKVVQMNKPHRLAFLYYHQLCNVELLH